MHKQFYRLNLAFALVIVLTTACIRPLAAPLAAPPTAPLTATGAGTADLPRFTHPTEITNPFYPASLIAQTISLGQEGGAPLRVEVTAMPDTKLIAWQGEEIEARVLQFLAWRDGKIVELAYDYFAQGDDGGVYYLGETVFNYAAGKVANQEGSWLAGQAGAPPALIMPAKPAVGQVFNPENLPGVVFETVEVLSLNQHANTPTGSTEAGLRVEETLMDGSIEHKIYVADWGVVETQATDEQINLVWFNRTDAKPGALPAPLLTLEAQAEDIFDVAPQANWTKVTADLAAINEAWQAYQAQVATDHMPQLFQDAFMTALEQLQKAAAAADSAETRQAANDLSAAIIDLFAIYQPTVVTDLGRLDVLERQVGLDVAAADFSAATDSLAQINAIWERLKPVLLARSGAEPVSQFDDNLATQQEALAGADGAALTTAAQAALEVVDALEQFE